MFQSLFCWIVLKNKTGALKFWGGNKFQIAKGKLEEGESDKQAVFREAGEELGLFRGNVTHEHDLGNFLGRTQIFLAEIEYPDMFGDPHFETDEVKWMTLDEFVEQGRGLHVPVVKAAHRWIIANKDK